MSKAIILFMLPILETIPRLQSIPVVLLFCQAKNYPYKEPRHKYLSFIGSECLAPSVRISGRHCSKGVSAGCLVVSGGRVRPYRNAASREYMEAEDTTGQWFEECAEIKPESWTLIGLLYRSYTEWTKENGLTE